MANQADKNYFARRVEEELEWGNQAASSSIAAIHYELAFRYALKCVAGRAQPSRMRLVNGGKALPVHPEPAQLQTPQVAYDDHELIKVRA